MRTALYFSAHVRHVMRPTCAISSDDRQHMRHALELAKKGLGKTHPNPAVGCVILKDGKVGSHALTGTVSLTHRICWNPRRSAMPEYMQKIFMEVLHIIQVIGEGYHPEAGKPHAEVYALRAAGQAAKGATAYVTLEPCNHYGRTPPCSRALVAAEVSRVCHCQLMPSTVEAAAALGSLPILRRSPLQLLVLTSEGAVAGRHVTCESEDMPMAWAIRP